VRNLFMESFLKFIYSCCWLCIVAVLSFPSVAYAVVSAIPFNNTLKLSAWWLKFFQYQAALVMVLVDMFITPKAVRFFADAPAFEYPCYLFPSIPLVIMSQHNSYVKLPEGIVCCHLRQRWEICWRNTALMSRCLAKKKSSSGAARIRLVD